MVGRDITPTEIGKHSKLIKAAQEEMSTIDVLVCGRCLSVFHFIEDFKQHKQKPCHKESNNVRECNDTKPKIWAFLLWKATQLNNNKDSNTASPNSWSLYQTWVKMDESLRETWIVAGKTIQSFAKVGQGNLQEMPVKITKTVVNNNADTTSPGRKPLTQTKPQVANLKPPIKMGTVSNKHDSENETSSTKGNTPVQKIIKKPIQTASAVQLPNKPSTNPTKPLSRRANRNSPNSDVTTEENVDKIVAKRFNPRRKMHEYLVKWETRPNTENTWEPTTNLENVPHILETFEKQLARQKEARAAMQAKQQAGAVTSKTPESIKKDGKNIVTSDTSDGNKASLNSPSGVESSGRPPRTSKTKAMDQVKQWMSGVSTTTSATASPISTASETATAIGQENEKDWSMNSTSGIKRKLDDSDYNDSNASDFQSTTATMEDLEEDLIPSHTVKRMKNGNTVSIESKQIKVNGNVSSRNSSVSGEALSVTPNSAEVIITQDANASGVVKKPGYNGISTSTPKNEAQIRILSKGESAVSSTGIVRISSSNNGSDNGDHNKVNRVSTTQVRVGGRQTPTVSNSTSTVGSGTQITVTQRQTQIQRTPGGTTIQRKIVSAGSTQQPQLQQQQQQTRTTITSQVRSGIQTQQTSPSSGRMIIPRSNVGRPSATNSASKNVTPEQKILQLSKSGDLKVTKKIMTREDAVAQRMASQQRQQQQLRQQQSQVQIQKVQQIAPPAATRGSASTLRVQEEHQAQLCPITGKLLGQDDQPQQQQQQQQLQSGVLQITDHQQEQQQMHDIDPTLLLTGGDQQLLTNEDGTPLLVTGEDGTVYQVAGKNAEGQTILVTQGPDGEQQFAYVAAANDGDENQVLTLDNAMAEAVAQLPAEQQAEALAAAAGEGQYLVKTTQEDGTTQVVTMSESELAQHQALAQQQQQQQQQAAAGAGSATSQLCIQTGDGSDGQEANIPAEVVQADLPSPGGTRRVVLLLQDGTFMMTEMHDDEFKALNIAA